MRRQCATLAPLQRDWREAAPEMYFMTIETLLARPGWISMEHPLTPTQTIFERNPYYFKVDAAGNQLPYIDGIVSTKVEGSEGANLKIIAGEVDLADELAKISSLPLYRENEGNGYRALGSGVPYNPVVHAFNFAYEDPLWREIAGDLRFRQALNLAINRDEIIDAVYYGFASPPVWVPTEFNLEEANRLLDEVGLDQRDNDGWRLGPDGERFEINLEVSAHLPDTVLIVNERLDNVFTEGVAQWVIYSSEQLFYGS